jgi:hypothetical protein
MYTKQNISHKTIVLLIKKIEGSVFSAVKFTDIVKLMVIIQFMSRWRLHPEGHYTPKAPLD